MAAEGEPNSKSKPVTKEISDTIVLKENIKFIKDRADLDQKLSDAGNQLVIIDFFATWCGPCKMISPKLEELAEEFADIQIFKVDVDECEDIAMEFNISSMPTFIFIKNKQTVTQFSGANYEKLRQLAIEHK